MYKGTSPSQEKTAQAVFSLLKMTNPDCTMGYSLNQDTGYLTIDIEENNKTCMGFTINRNGTII
jgi:hypothetical protein